MRTVDLVDLLLSSKIVMAIVRGHRSSQGVL